MALSDGRDGEHGKSSPIVDETMAKHEKKFDNSKSKTIDDGLESASDVTSFANAELDSNGNSSSSTRQTAGKADLTAFESGDNNVQQTLTMNSSSGPNMDKKVEANGRRKETVSASASAERSVSSGNSDNSGTSSGGSTSSSNNTTSDNDSLPALEDGNSLSSSARRATTSKAVHAKNSLSKSKGKGKRSASSGSADERANDSPPPLESSTPPPSSSGRFRIPVSQKSRSNSSANIAPKEDEAAASSKRKLPSSSDSSAVGAKSKSDSSRAKGKKSAPSPHLAAACSDDSDEPPPLLDESRRRAASSSGDSSDDNDNDVERVVRRQLDSMVDAIAESDDDEDDDDEDDDEWDTPTSGEDDDDDDGSEPMDIQQMMLDAMDTDSDEDSNSSNDSPATDNEAHVEASDTYVVTLNDDGEEQAAPGAAADADGMPALEDPTDAAVIQRNAERARRAEALRATRAEFARNKRRQRQEAKTPPDSDYEQIDKLDVCNPFPREASSSNISRKLFAKESQRSCLGSSFGDAVYGSLFSARKLELMRKLDGGDVHNGHEGCVNACNFNDDGSLLVSGSDDLKICIWDWAASDVARVKFASGHHQNVFQTKFLPYNNSSLVVTCSRDGQVRLAELSGDGKCKETRLLGEHGDSAHKLAVRRDSGSQFYSCGEDGYVKHYDLRDSRPCRDIVCVRKTRQPPASASSSSSSSSGDAGGGRDGREDVITLYAIDCNPLNNNEFLVCGLDDAVRIYDLRYARKTTNDSENSYNALPIKTFCPAKFRQPDRKMRHISASCAVYDWNGSNVLASYNDHNIFEFDNRGGAYDGGEKSGLATKTVHNDLATHVFRGHRNRATVKGVNYFGPRSEFVVSGSDCGHVFLWHRETERVVNMLAADEQGVVNVLESHPTAPVLATSGLDHDIKIWVPSNESPKLQCDQINRRAQKNIRERKRNEKRPVMSMPSGFMVALLNHLNAQRERGASANNNDNNDEEENDNNEDGAVRGGAAARRRRRQRARRAGGDANEAEGDNGGNDDDEDNDDGDVRPIRCGVS